MTPNINKGLEHLPQTTPPDMVWENIERKLDENKSQRAAFWLKFTAGVAAAIVVFAFSFFLFSNIEDENLGKTAQQKSNQHPPAFSHSTPPTLTKEDSIKYTAQLQPLVDTTMQTLTDSIRTYMVFDATNMQALSATSTANYATSQPTLNGALSYN